MNYENFIVKVYAIHIDTVQRKDWTPLYRIMPGRMEKAHRYKFEKDRLLCVGAGILMKDILGIKNETELKTNPFGKLLAPGYPNFNLSHSGEYTLLVMGTGEIGVDIEKIEPTHLNIASSVYTVDEITWMNESPLERFHILWTWKESAMKAIGTGMSIEPISFEVLPFSQNKSIPLNGRQLYGKTDKIKDYRYSVCSTQPIEELEWIEWNKDLVKR